MPRVAPAFRLAGRKKLRADESERIRRPSHTVETVMAMTRARKGAGVSRLLKAQLDGIVVRLQTEADVPQTSVPGGDFLDAAQGIEHQELARLSASRLTERAKRLRIALARVAEGEYERCSECGASIPPKRLLAVPDATTCRPCQEMLERAGR
jgi:RNA polymerase-binding transcription factor DksA